jgi:ABC-type dipeptide/oligopeptide/nickel transport system permease component
MIPRLLSICPIIFGVVLLTFLLLRLVPGDPVDVMLGESATQADKRAIEDKLGLNQPIYLQFSHYIASLVKGDLGQSIQYQTSIKTLILSRFPATLKLAGAAFIFAIVVGLPLGIFAAVTRLKWLDQLINILTLLISGMPHFWLGPLLMMLFGLSLGLLPISGMDANNAFVLPALTLGLGLTAILVRMTRVTMLEVMHEDFIRTAYAKGLSSTQVIFRHGLRAALLPIITLLGLQLGSLLAGAVITETVFAWDGIGRLLVESIERRDYPLTQACVLVISISYVLINVLTDIIYQRVDPRVRFTK